jgi:Tfp pilus assembly protein PilN
MAQSDALARKRVRLERVLQTRLGHADVINVMSPTRVQLGTLAATADAIAVTGVRAIRVERQGPDRLLILFDPAP